MSASDAKKLQSTDSGLNYEWINYELRMSASDAKKLQSTDSGLNYEWLCPIRN
ncbi:hypothetical protein [Microscilla marina]|uniref:hypothetical protein n=1 Tax=Microscilla marina TaxID=1027 RepID=UPI0012F9C81E|nr:hypothetical protein [Microscilla marina]